MNMKRMMVLAPVVGLVLGLTTGVAYAGDKGGGHDPVTFCHNGHTITTDDDGLIKGHLRHVESGKDYLGECTPEPDPTDDPEVTHLTVTATYTPGSCDAATNVATQPVVVKDPADGVLWLATGPDNAKTFTATEGYYDVVIDGTTVFGPYDMTAIICTPSSEPIHDTPGTKTTDTGGNPLVLGESG